ncbi:type 2 lantipeptide synthetase LanM [Halobacillus fulvus]|nr:type 2 lantipeptide synthetase LanM [Halobacillus fulvus]
MIRMDFNHVIASFLENHLEIREAKEKLPYRQQLSEQLLDQLKVQLTPVVIQVLSAEYEGYKEHFKYDHTQALEGYTKQVTKEDYIEELVKGFPLMNKRLQDTTTNFLSYANEIYENLHIHKEHSGFQSIDEIKLSLGDTHNNGKTVCQLTLDGEVYYYKPRNAMLDQKFLDFLSDHIDHYTNNIYNYDHFSIHQEIKGDQNHSTRDTTEKYFYNIGFLSSVFYFMASTDMHFENVIVTGQTPHFIDLETISDLTDFEKDTHRNDLFLTLSDSVFQSMIYPFEMTENYLNISALTGSKGDVPKFHYKNTIPTINDRGELDFSEVNPQLEEQKNEVFLEGDKQIPSQYIEEITAGFKAFCEIVLRDPDGVYEQLTDITKDFPIRQIVRPTHIYAKYLNIGTEPYYLRNEDHFNELFSHLKGSTPDLIFEEEKRHMQNGDIPLFYTFANSRDLYASGRIVAENYFVKTIKENIHDRIYKFSPKKLEQEVSHIASSLFIYHYNYERQAKVEQTRKPSKNLDPISYLRGFMNKFQTVNESYSALLPSFSGEKMIISPITPSLFEYGGNLLMGIYFRERIGLSVSDIKRLFATMKEWKTFSYEDWSGFNGGGAYLYLLLNTYKWTQDEYFYRLLLQEIDEAASCSYKVENIDYFTGLSGSLAILCEIYESIEEKEAKAKIKKLLSSFNTSITSNLERMETSESRIGLSHGYSGVILALSRYDRILGQTQNKDLIKILMDYEEHVYDEKANNYLDMRDQTTDKYYLCYGLVGTLFSRIELFENGWTDLKDDIQKRALVLAEQLVEGNIDLSGYSYCLCHGIGGFIELFKEIERTGIIQTEELTDVYNLLFTTLKTSVVNGVDNPLTYDGFMLGEGGPTYNHIRHEFDINSLIRLKALQPQKAPIHSS